MEGRKNLYFWSERSTRVFELKEEGADGRDNSSYRA